MLSASLWMYQPAHTEYRYPTIGDPELAECQKETDEMWRAACELAFQTSKPFEVAGHFRAAEDMTQALAFVALPPLAVGAFGLTICWIVLGFYPAEPDRRDWSGVFSHGAPTRPASMPIQEP
jgi:hypothetical protein